MPFCCFAAWRGLLLDGEMVTGAADVVWRVGLC